MTSRSLGAIGFDSVRGILAAAAYLPLLVWGPLLGALTVHYLRRRMAAAGGHNCSC